ncbi:MAG: YicC/YloC family endoribonuclease [Akkermansia sp.]
MNSMTGFGRAIASLPETSVRVEISGVNRKQVEIVINVPRSCPEWEQSIRPLILKNISRGRVNITISIENDAQSATNSLSLDKNKLANLIAITQEVNQTASLQLHVEDLLRLNIISDNTNEQLNPAESWLLIEPAVQSALHDFIAMRRTEGEHLKADILSRIDTLKNIRQQIMMLAPSVPKKLGEAMKQRLIESGIPIDMNDDRLIRELALFADKCDITEETSRLASHFTQFQSICAADTPAGRPLDFLCQEIFREFNTIGSKANDASLAHLVVTAKTELEKVREQVQNIE